MEALKAKYAAFKEQKEEEGQIMKAQLKIQNQCLPTIKAWMEEMKHEFFLQLSKLNANYVDRETENVIFKERLHALQTGGTTQRYGR